MPNFLSIAYITLLSTTGYIKCCIVPTWPHNNRTNFYNFRFVLMLVSIQLRNPATGSQKANTNPIFFFRNFGFGVLQSQKCYAMFRCIECYLTKTELARDPISVKPSLISLCTDVPPPSEKIGRRVSRFFPKEGGRLYTGYL